MEKETVGKVYREVYLKKTSSVTKKDWVTVYIRKHRKYWKGSFDYFILPKVICSDGFTVSMQISKVHYCMPKTASAERYTHTELGFPSVGDPLIKDYAEDPEDETNTVYPYVPIEVVNALFEKHGGISN